MQLLFLGENVHDEKNIVFKKSIAEYQYFDVGQLKKFHTKYLHKAYSKLSWPSG